MTQEDNQESQPFLFIPMVNIHPILAIHAMSVELKALENNKTWEIIHLHGKKFIKCRSDETLKRYKAKHSVKGYDQEYRIKCETLLLLLPGAHLLDHLLLQTIIHFTNECQFFLNVSFFNIQFTNFYASHDTLTYLIQLLTFTLAKFDSYIKIKT